MKKSLAHLPQDKADEVELIAFNIRALCEDVQMVILFGSYARGDWKDGQHSQGRGMLIIHKKSDYDILVITKEKATAKNLAIWQKINRECMTSDLTTHARVIAHDIQFINIRLAEGRYFFKDIKKEGVILYDSGKFKLARKQKLKPIEEQRIAQDYFDKWLGSAKEFYDNFKFNLNKRRYKNAAFQLHQAAEQSLKAVLLVFTEDAPHEHWLDLLCYKAAKFDAGFSSIFPKETDEQKELLELLEYAYIGARFDPDYYITEDELKYLAKYVKKLHKLTEKVCVEKIKSFA